MKFKLWLLIACSALPLSVVASCGPCTIATTPTDTEAVAIFRNAVFSPQGCLAAANINDNSVLLYSINQATCEVTLVSPAISSGIATPRALAFSPTGSCLAVGNFGNNTVTLYALDPATCSPVVIPPATGPEPTATITLPDGDPLSDTLQAIALSSQGCLAIAVQAGANSRILLYSIDPDDCTVTELDPIEMLNSAPLSVAFSPDGNCLVVGRNGAVDLYSITDCVATFADSITNNIGSFIAGPSALAISPQNCLAIRAGSGQTVDLYGINPDCTATDLSTGSVSVGSSIVSMAFSANNCLAVAFGSSIEIYSITDGCAFISADPVQPALVPGGDVRSVAYSSNGACLATVSGNLEDVNTLTLYQTAAPVPPVISVTPGCNSITVMGTTRANASITIFINGVPATTVDADDSGLFATMLTVAPGSYVINAQAADPNPPFCTSDFSNGVSVIVPTGPTIDQVSSTCLGTINIIGSAAPGTSVTILVDGVPVATVVAQPFGSFGRFLATNVPVSTGFHCISAVDNATGCAGAPVCLNVTLTSCILVKPNLAFGTHCCNRQ